MQNQQINSQQPSKERHHEGPSIVTLVSRSLYLMAPTTCHYSDEANYYDLHNIPIAMQDAKDNTSSSS